MPKSAVIKYINLTGRQVPCSDEAQFVVYRAPAPWFAVGDYFQMRIDGLFMEWVQLVQSQLVAGHNQSEVLALTFARASRHGG